jgi:hypothetical protein
MKPRLRATRRWTLLGMVLASLAAPAVLANNGPVLPPRVSPLPAFEPLTLEQVLARNAAARGGVEAWRKIQTMAWAGRVETSNAQAPSVPFMLEVERPNKTHFEFVGMNQRMLRVFNGSAGWKLRPPQNGGLPEVLPFSAEEARFAREEQVVDGLLLDHEAKGLALAVEGMDVVDDRAAYRIAVRMPSGETHHVWVDARSYLEVRMDRETRTPSGAHGQVSVFYRNYREFEGLQIPCVIETSRGSGGIADRIVIDRVALNPPLTDREFAKPGMPVRRKGVVIDIEPGAPAGVRQPER